MNTFRFAILLTVMACLATAVYSQTTTRTAETELRALDLAAAKAVLEKDEKAIARYFTKDSVTNNPRNGLTRGSDGIIDAVRTNLVNYHSFTRALESVQVIGNTAVTMGNETVVMKGPDGGAGRTVERRYTNIWMKRGKTWQIVARHANVICN